MNVEKTGAFKLSKGTGSAAVFPNSFWRAYEISHKEWSGQYIPKHVVDNEHGKIYYIKLSEKEERPQKVNSAVENFSDTTK